VHRYVVFGINHKFAPLEVRERVAYPERRVPAALHSICDALTCREAVLLSTCNRVEVYAHAEDDEVRSRLVNVLASDHAMKAEWLDKYCYFHRGREAVEHLMRVAGGVDSLVLGETQILAQVKRAYLLAQSEDFTGKALNTLFHRVFQVAKRIHHETGISEGQVSVSSVGVKYVERVFDELGDKTVLLLGAGEVGELTLTYLREKGIGRVIVVSRTLERAKALAEHHNGDAVPIDLLDDYLSAADIVITQTSAEGRILTRRQFAQSQRKRGYAPVFVLDLAVPRDVEEASADLEGVYLYNVDDLERVIAEQALERSKELEQCRAIIREESERYLAHYSTHAAGELIATVRRKAEEAKDHELDRLLSRLSDIPVSQKAEIEAFAGRLMNKLLHPQIQGIRDESARGGADAARRIAVALGLDQDINLQKPRKQTEQHEKQPEPDHEDARQQDKA
jgi:glutamyl-tRNA reductase